LVTKVDGEEDSIILRQRINILQWVLPKQAVDRIFRQLIDSNTSPQPSGSPKYVERKETTADGER